MPDRRSIQFTEADVRLTLCAGVLIWRICCPLCGRWFFASDPQFYGRTPMRCGKSHCDFKTTIDLSDVPVDWTYMVGRRAPKEREF